MVVRQAVWTSAGLDFDQARAKEASAAQRAEREARGIKTELPDIYDETTDGRELLAAAVTKAKQEEKRVLLIWGANWCTPCHLLEQFIERSPDVTEVLESRYIVVHMCPVPNSIYRN